ncbi:sensor histidine kinase, partial [Solirhodobacter olei]|uniref:sensor histidine kinase n=1 Tax=Solirhodobacter olei TaxID=2493082 RepID=UPI0013E2DB0D
ALKLMASGKMGQIEERPLGLIQVALRNVERLVVMINDLLDLEKVAAGKMEMKLQPTDVSKVLEDALASNESYAAEFGVRLIRIGTKASVIVDANHDRLVQVLNNLLSNAAKFSPRGETVEAELRNTRGAVQIIVRDHGAGIPEEYGDR